MQHAAPKDQRKITSTLQHVSQCILALRDSTLSHIVEPISDTRGPSRNKCTYPYYGVSTLLKHQNKTKYYIIVFTCMHINNLYSNNNIHNIIIDI